jgi:hypothetical protein
VQRISPIFHELADELSVPVEMFEGAKARQQHLCQS